MADNIYKKEKLKGGSLSQTSLMYSDNEVFVRKEVHLSKNREYGFRRWYSQLKRQQRYNLMFPGLFPDILRYSVDDENAYFDMEYIEKSVNALDYVAKESDPSKIDAFFNELIKQMNKLHSLKMKSCPDIARLYIREEVGQSISACVNLEFLEFSRNEFINYNGQNVETFVKKYEEFSKILKKLYKESHESFSHGNLTLENILYVPEEGRIVFIDPYEENIIDSNLADYSQLLQSCNAKYEMIDSLLDKDNGPDHYGFFVKGNEVSIDIPNNFGLDYFNTKINEFLKNELSQDSYKVVKLLEISQFIRMLPFKQEKSIKKMIVFYSLASKLFYDLKKSYGN